MDRYPDLMNPGYRNKILEFLKSYIDQKNTEFSAINRWGPDVCGRLSKFVPSGKVIRGCLVMFINEALGGEDSSDVLFMASAMELLHAALLIQDDFMDKDTKRRKQHSIFYQYQLKGKQDNITDYDHYGNSLSICVGNVTFFIGYSLLSRIKDKNKLQTASEIFSREMEVVSLSQMEDVYHAYSDYQPTQKEIEQLRVLKSGRYTIALPMMIGGVGAGVPLPVLDRLKSIGEKVGLVFQLRDDELGIFGLVKKTGKPEGTDVKENKKTLHRFLLYRYATEKEKIRIDNIFGNNNINEDELGYVRELMIKKGIVNKIRNRIDQAKMQAEQELRELRLDKKYEIQFMEFIEFLATREK